jgi:ABC-type transporter Mla subunit MlaD
LHVDIEKAQFDSQANAVVITARETTERIGKHFKETHETIIQSMHAVQSEAAESYQKIGRAASDSGASIQEQGRKARESAGGAAGKVKDLGEQMEKSAKKTEDQSQKIDKAAKSTGDLSKKTSDSGTEVDKASAKSSKFTGTLKKFGEAGQEAYKKLKEAGTGANGVSEAIGVAAGKLTGLPIGPAIEFINKVKDGFLELDRVAKSTGLGADKITEFEDVIQHAGVSAKEFPDELQKLSDSMYKARDGSEANIKSFNALGISTKGWKDHLPSLDQILLQVADHVKNSTSPEKDLAAATALLGDKGKELIPVLRQGSDAIRKQMKDHEAHGQAVLASINSARQLQESESRLADELQKILLPAFDAIVFVLRMFVAGLYKVWAGLKILVALLVSGAKTAWEFAKAVYDAFQAMNHGDISGAVGRMKQFLNTMRQDSENTMKYISDTWAEGNRQADAVLADNLATVATGQNNINKVVKDGVTRRAKTQQDGDAANVKSSKQSDQQMVQNHEVQLGVMIGDTDHAMQVISKLLSGIGSAPPPRLANDPGVQATRNAEKQKDAIVKKSVDYRQDLEKSLSKNIQSFFSSSIMGMIQGTESLGQAVAKMGQQMLQSFVDTLSKMTTEWIEQHILMKIFGIKTSAETSQADIQGSAAAGAAAAGASAAKLPFGWALIAPITMAVFGMLSAFKGRVNSAAGGFYEVDRDQLALIHKNEMVLPAGIADRLRSAVSSGGGSAPDVHVHVYHNINAIDAASFKDTIKQHGNMIGNEVARVLKRKNIGTR